MDDIRAVLTGDLVASTAAPAARVEATMAVIMHVAGSISDATGKDTRFTRFRGDGWQIVLSQPAHCFRSAASVLAALRTQKDTLETRIAIGLGTVLTLGSSDLGDAQGEAFQRSGHALDKMARQRRLAIEGPWGDFMHWPKAAFSFLEHASARWSCEQAEAVALMLQQDPPTQTDAAQRLKISRQALRDRLDGAGLRVLIDMLHAFEAISFPPRTGPEA